MERKMTTKIHSFNAETNDECSGTENVYKALRRFLRLTGLYIDNFDSETPCSKGLRFCMIIYSIFCNLCTLCMLLRASDSFVRELKMGILFSVTQCIFSFEVAYLSVIMSLTFSRNLKSFLSSLTDDKKEYRQKTRKLTLLMYALFFAILGVCMPINILSNFVFPSRDTTAYVGFPFANFPPYLKRFVSFIVMIIETFGSVRFFMTVVVFNIVSFTVFTELGLFSTKFKQAYREGKEDFPTLPELWNEQLSLFKMVESAQVILKHFIAVTFLATIPLICFLVLLLMRHDSSVIEVGILTSIFCVCIAQLLNVILVSVAINNKAHKPLEHIFESPLPAYREETLHKLSLFISKLSTQKIGYCIYGLFTIDKSAIIMVFGTILTYGIVVVQLPMNKNMGNFSGVTTESYLWNNATEVSL